MNTGLFECNLHGRFSEHELGLAAYDTDSGVRKAFCAWCLSEMREVAINELTAREYEHLKMLRGLRQ